MNATTAQQETALLLADGLFLLAHDELSGKPRLSESVMSLGLAGALLGELALAEKILVRGESQAAQDRLSGSRIGDRRFLLGLRPTRLVDGWRLVGSPKVALAALVS